MRRFLYYIFLGTLLQGCQKRDPVLPIPPNEVNLTDTSMVPFSPGFEQVLINNKIIEDETVDGWVRLGEVSKIDTLNIPGIHYENQNIKSFKGLEYFKQLTYLDVTGSFVDSLDLSKNTMLEYLACSGLSPIGGGDTYTIKYLNVSNNKKLRYLECQRNLLTSLDVSQNTQLKELHCGENNLKDLDISNNSNLKILETSANRDLKKLNVSPAKELQELYCSYNELTYLDVSMLKDLRVLDCSFNSLAYIKASDELNLSNNLMLESIDISGLKLSKIDLHSNSLLKVLIMALIPNMSVINLGSLKNLLVLDASYSALQDLDVSLNTELTDLIIRGTSVRNVDLKSNVNLKTFICYQQNYITAIDLRPCRKLVRCLTYQCPNLKALCVNKLPDPADDKWQTSEWTKYLLCD